MNDLSILSKERELTRNPFATVFAIEQEVFKQQKAQTLDSLEKGAIRFTAKQSFEPHEKTIESVSKSKEDASYVIQGGLVNLSGPNGILPNHYSESLAKTLRDKKTAYKDFLDIFNHRANSLMYRSWAKYRLDADNVYKSHVDQYQSSIDLMLSALSGETPNQADQSGFYFAGLSYSSTMSSEKLKTMIQAMTNLTVKVNQFKGKWIELEDEQLSRMSSKSYGERFNQLGVNTMLGRRCWDLNSGFEIEFEVNDANTFNQLTPTGELHQQLKNMIKKSVGIGYDFNFKLRVKEAHCKRVRLRKGGGATKLGANAWMGNTTDHHKTINYYC